MYIVYSQALINYFVWIYKLIHISIEEDELRTYSDIAMNSEVGDQDFLKYIIKLYYQEEKNMALYLFSGL